MDVLSEPLTDAQVRIVGVLLEKQMATPQSYPLTENALLTGCNQSTNRYPLVDYDTSVVRPALIRLRERGLVKRVHRAGERAEKHAHRLDEQLGLSTPGLAVLAVLLLRGPQTPGELRSRTQRLQAGIDVDTLDAALEELRDRGFAEPLPRRPGEKQVRWRHLLAGVDAPVDQGPGYASEPRPEDPDRPRMPSLHDLNALVERLHDRVTRLERELGLEADGPADGDADHAAADHGTADPGPDAASFS